jgi:hypothetical protein
VNEAVEIVELLRTLERQMRTVLHTTNYLSSEVTEIRSELAAILRARPPNPCRPRMRHVAGIVFMVQSGEIVMSGSSSPIALTNVANPAVATRYLGVVDIANGNVLPVPTVTAGNAALVTIVSAAALNASSQFVFGVYPIDAAAETNDPVEITLELAGDTTPIVYEFVISGTPVPPPPETETTDAASAVGAWANAPAVPATPV